MSILGWTTTPSGSGDEFGTGGQKWIVPIGQMPEAGTVDSVEFYCSFPSSPVGTMRWVVAVNGAAANDPDTATVVAQGTTTTLPGSIAWWSIPASGSLASGDNVYVGIKGILSSGSFFLEREGADPSNGVLSPINYSSDDGDDGTVSWGSTIAITTSDAPANRWGGARIQYTATTSGGPRGGVIPEGMERDSASGLIIPNNTRRLIVPVAQLPESMRRAA